LVILPEGTVTNNTGLLTFKKGAFKDFKRMKIIACTYPHDEWLYFVDEIPEHY